MFFTALAFDPLQKIMAIGNRSGKVRLYGRPGVDVEFKHQKEVAVFKIIFVVNSGRLLTATTDNAVSLWDFKRRKTPERIQWIQMQRENITEICLEFQDKWLYIGTDKGNVHILNMDTFSLSGYKIDWNRLMDPLTKHLPGKQAYWNFY